MILGKNIANRTLSPMFSGIRIDVESFKKYLKPETAQLYLAAFRQAAKDMAPLLPAAQKDVDLWVRLAKKPLIRDGKTLPYTVQCELKAQESPENSANQALQNRFSTMALPAHALSDSPYQILSTALAQLSQVLMTMVGEAFRGRVVTLEAENQTLKDDLEAATGKAKGGFQEGTASQALAGKKAAAQALLEEELNTLEAMDAQINALAARYDTLVVKTQTLVEARDYATQWPETIRKGAKALLTDSEFVQQQLDKLFKTYSTLTDLSERGVEEALEQLAPKTAQTTRDTIDQSLEELDTRMDSLSFDLMVLMDTLEDLMR